MMVLWEQQEQRVQQELLLQAQFTRLHRLTLQLQQAQQE
jgi:hypothetical protein